MEFLQKLMAITKNVVQSLRLFNAKHSPIQINEQLMICVDAQIETFKVANTIKIPAQRDISDQQTQTEELQLKDENFPVVKSQTYKYIDLLKRDSKSKRKNNKVEEKLQKSIDSNSQSDKTQPSEYSYCQNHFLDALENNEKEFQRQIGKCFIPAKRRTSKQTKAYLFHTYLNFVKDQYVENQGCQKSTKSTLEEIQSNQPEACANEGKQLPS